MSVPYKEKPMLSVVIVSFNDLALLERCLNSLQGQVESADTEVIVISNLKERIEQMIEKQFSFVRYIALTSGTTVPKLRTEGISRARGDIIAIIEDLCIFDKNWCAEIKRAHQSSYPAIGGSIENLSTKRLFDWAVYFCDYGKYMGPNKAGLTDTLVGNNVSYKRGLLEEIRDEFREGFFEIFIHEKLKKRGKLLYLAPAAVVYHIKNYGLLETFSHSFHHGRAFAGMRLSRASFVKRLVFGPGSVILPLLLPLRKFLTIIKKRRHIKELFLSLPYIFLLMLSWSYGEFCGYLFGEGKSAEKWR